MGINKRDFLKLSGVTVGAAALGACSPAVKEAPASTLTSITDDVTPIGVDERLARVEKAQRLMGDYDLDAILLEPGSAMLYFSAFDGGRVNDLPLW